jgi:hypothetical protein
MQQSYSSIELYGEYAQFDVLLHFWKPNVCTFAVLDDCVVLRCTNYDIEPRPHIMLEIM